MAFFFRPSPDVPSFLFRNTGPVKRLLLLVVANKVVDHRVKKDAANANGAAEELDGVEGFAHHDGHAHDHNHALGGVGHRLSDRVGLLEGHGGELVVAVEPKARKDEVELHHVVGLDQLSELGEAVAFASDRKRDGREERNDGGQRKLVAHRANAVLEASGRHELLVLLALEGSEAVGNARGEKRGPREVELLDRGQDNAANHRDERQPLGGGNRRRVEQSADL